MSRKAAISSPKVPRSHGADQKLLINTVMPPHPRISDLPPEFTARLQTDIKTRRTSRRSQTVDGLANDDGSDAIVVGDSL